MYVCPNCHYHSTTPMNYCLNCGTKATYVENQQPRPQEQDQYQHQYQQQYQQTYYQQPYYQQPHYTEPRRPSNLGRKIPGMIMGIVGFVTALIGLIYTLIFVVGEAGAISFVFSIIFALESLPLSIIGRSLCHRCIDEGDESKMASSGSGLGLAGIILTIIMLVLGFLSLATI